MRPSDQVLSAIATALRLDDSERAHLVAISTDNSVPAEEFEYLSPEVAAIPRLLGPNPAYVTGSSYDLLACNDAAVELFGEKFDSHRSNLARWMFLEPAAREILPDWPEVAQGLLARLRTNAGRHPGSPRFERLERELRAASVEADAWWPRYDIASSHTGVKRIRDRSGSEQQITYTSFQVSEQPEQVLTIYRLT